MTMQKAIASCSHRVVFVLFVFVIVGCGDGNNHASRSPGSRQDATGDRPPADHSQPAADYPLTTCVVSGEGLSSMGRYVAIQYEGREVRFCCRSCVDEFKKEPGKYLAVLDEAADDHPMSPQNGMEHDHHDHGANTH